MSPTNVSLTTAFIDLSTFDEIEVYLYGGMSVNRFRKTIRRSAWFTIIAAQLNKVGTIGDFDSEMQAMFSRAGDYIRDCWLRVELPQVQVEPGFQARWTRNIGHNLIETAELMYNDLVVNKLTSYHLDFLQQFCGNPGKTDGYMHMIGNRPELVNPYEIHPDISATNPIALPRAVLNIPLPFYFTRDPSDAILQAACPFNDIKVQIKFRNWRNLLLIDELTGVAVDPLSNLDTRQVNLLNAPDYSKLTTMAPKLSSCGVWAHYAVIPNADREKIAEEPDIDTLIEQVQHISASSYNPLTSDTQDIELRFAHSIRAVFFALRNKTYENEWSNYQTHPTRALPVGRFGIDFQPPGAANPVARAVLQYENVDRVNMYSDYFTHVAPFYTAPMIPREIGYHLLPYCNSLCSIQADGSTNYARLSSVHLALHGSDVAKAQAGPVNTGVAAQDPAYVVRPGKFDSVVTASSLTILRMTAGSAGFPVL
jgi:hypothetical protein